MYRKKLITDWLTCLYMTLTSEMKTELKLNENIINTKCLTMHSILITSIVEVHLISVYQLNFKYHKFSAFDWQWAVTTVLTLIEIPIKELVEKESYICKT